MNRRMFMKTGILATAGARNISFRSDDLTVGIIGHTGRGNYGHNLDTLWMSVPGVRIAAVADADEKGLAAAAQRLRVDRKFTDYREMLKQVRPDLVCIAPRHIDQHRDMAVAACTSGARGIYMEKPFCRTLSEAREILDAGNKSGTRIALAHRNRYHPALPVAQKLADGGILGEILEVRARGKEDRRGGLEDLWVLGSHVLNIIPLFTGKFTACTAGIYNNGAPVTRNELVQGAEGIGTIGGNSLHARFETEKGIPVFFDSLQDRGTKGANFGFQLIGTQGIMDIRIDTEPLIHLLNGNPTWPSPGVRQWIPVTSAGVGKEEPVTAIDREIAGHHAAVKDLIRAVKENREPLCNAREGLELTEALMAVMESHRTGGGRVAWPVTMPGNPLDLL